MVVKRKQTTEERKAKQRAAYQRNKERIKARQRAYSQAVAAGEREVGTCRLGRKVKLVDEAERRRKKEVYQHRYYLVHKLAPRIIQRLHRMDAATPEAEVRASKDFQRLVEIGTDVIPLILAEIDAGRSAPWCQWAIRALRSWKVRQEE